MSPARLHAITNVLAASFVALLGGALFWLVGLPVPWLSGSIIATSIAGLARWIRPTPDAIRPWLQIPLGMVMGTGVTPATFQTISAWPGSLGGLAVTVALMLAGSAAYLQFVSGWTRNTALCASLPGAFTAALAAANATGANVPLVSIAQVLRVMILAAVTPMLAHSLGNGGIAQLATEPPDVLQLSIVVVACSIGAVTAERLRIPTGLMMGAFLVSAALHGTGLVTVQVPWWILNPTLVLLGATTGSRFGQVPLRALIDAFGASFAAFLIATAVSAMGAVAFGFLLGLPPVQVFLAYAPGASEVMMLMAFALGLDPTYVGIHHIIRITVLLVAFPPIMRLWGGREAE